MPLTWCHILRLMLISHFMAVGFLLVFAGSLGKRLTAVLGGSLLAKVVGFVVAFVVLLGAEGGVGMAIGLAYAAFDRRWPDNRVKRLVEWVKAGPSDL
jgi:hypothetical protein